MYRGVLKGSAVSLGLLVLALAVHTAGAAEPPPPAPETGRPASGKQSPDTPSTAALLHPGDRAITVPSGLQPPPSLRDRVKVIASGSAVASEGNKFWLGLLCEQVPDVLRAQMKLPAGAGLFVVQVVPDGPAAHAGFQRNDVLLTAGGQPLADVAALAKVVNDSPNKEIEFSGLREGKPLTIKVTPVARRQRVDTYLIPGGTDRQAIEIWLQQINKATDESSQRPLLGKGRLRLQFLQAARLAGMDPEKPFPADLSVTIVRDGNNPAKITVKQGGKSWEIKSDELKKLPDAVRPFVTPYLQRLGMADVLKGGQPPPPPAAEQGLPIEIQVEGATIQLDAAKAELPSVPPIPDATNRVEGAIVVPGGPADPTTKRRSASSAPSAPSGRDADLKGLREQLRELQQRLDRLDVEKSGK